VLDSQASPVLSPVRVLSTHNSQSSSHSSPVVARKRAKRQMVELDLDLEVSMDTSDEEDAMEAIRPLLNLQERQD
jgi:hypothetical protein